MLWRRPDKQMRGTYGKRWSMVAIWTTLRYVFFMAYVQYVQCIPLKLDICRHLYFTFLLLSNKADLFIFPLASKFTDVFCNYVHLSFSTVRHLHASSWSAILHLNDVKEGGDTRFPALVPNAKPLIVNLKKDKAFCCCLYWMRTLG